MVVFARWCSAIFLYVTVGTAFLGQPALAKLRTVQVVEGIYALVGDKAQRSPENLGNNATFGLIVTENCVLLIDAGGSWKGAAEIDAAVRQITDRPVSAVVNTGGQDHRWLGNGYYQIMIRKPPATTWLLSAMGVMTLAEFDAFARGIGDAIPIERRVPVGI